MTKQERHPLTLRQARLLLELHSIANREALPKERLYKVTSLLEDYHERRIDGTQLQTQAQQIITM